MKVEVENTGPLENFSLIDNLPLDDPLKIYLGGISRFPLLTLEQEIALARRKDQGDEEARLQLLESNLRLVVHVAKKYRGQGMELIDLIQEGNFGLMEAVEGFDWTRGNKFSTFAHERIRYSILEGLVDKGRAIRLPGSAVEDLGRAYKANSRLTQALGREPTAGELAQEAGIAEERLKELLNADRAPESLDRKLGYGDSGSTLGDFIEDKSENNGSVSTVGSEEAIQGVLDGALTPREKRVLELRFGIWDGEERTLEEAGKELGVSRERVRQIETKALRKLRWPPNRLELRPYF